ncbi:CPA2 family monovalent cation:H+ antiporter-2 [Bradyrhizobium sp. i1.4.4]
MPHDTPLIATIVVGLGLAFVLGTIAQRFRIPPLVGYLLAGVAVGPFTPGFVADQALATELAELGIILLMFGVGLHFSLQDLLSVRHIAVPGAVVQIAVATLMGLGLSWLMGWSVGAGLVFGLALSVASTVVLLRALQERRLMETDRGRIAVGWLIVEDLAMVLVLVLFPAIASLQGASGDKPAFEPLAAQAGFGLAGIVMLTLAKIIVFIGLMLVVGRRVIPWILHYIAHTGSRELFRLGVLAIALCIAFGATKLFDVSLALGAFFAGMMLRESPLSARAAQESLPLRDAFAVLFFVSVGMMFDPMSVVREPWPLLATLAIIMLGKSLAAFLIVVLFRHPVATALTISASLSQIGEFSFILAELGVASQILPSDGRDLIMAGAILSIMLNPLMFAAATWLAPRLDPRRDSPQAAAAVPEPIPHHGPDRPYDRDRLWPRRRARRRCPEAAAIAVPCRRGRRECTGEAEAGRHRDRHGQCRAARNSRRHQSVTGAASRHRDPRGVRGRADRAAGACGQSGHPHHRASACGCRGRSFEGAGGGCRHHGRAGDRARHDRGAGEEKSGCCPARSTCARGRFGRLT